MATRLAVLLLAVAAGIVAGGCLEQGKHAVTVRAKQVTSADELIGGPGAKGKLGDFLIENDKVRFIIGGKGQGWAGGVFGGSLLDADRQRWWPEHRYGRGWDSFSETFPLVNLVVANPGAPGSELAVENGTVKLVATTSDIIVHEDGSQGVAVVRVTGKAGYMFEVLKFLNRDFLLSFLSTPLDLSSLGLPVPIPESMTADQIAKLVLGINVYGLINRLQVDFRFETDYILHEGESFLTIRTTISSAPPGESQNCPEVAECELEDVCLHGLALKEVEYKIPGQLIEAPGKVMCPVCQCAEAPLEMTTLNESEDIFNVMLGDLDKWQDPSWKGGLLGGDFLFFGSKANIFAPGLGFDEDRRIFENMWQKVPTLAAPLTFDWVAAVADNVSYGWVTVNPNQRDGVDCPAWRLAISRLGYEDEDEVIGILTGELGFDEDLAASRVRQAIVEGKPVDLAVIPTGTSEASEFDDWAAKVISETPVSSDPDAPDPRPIASLFPEGVTLDLVPQADCRSSKVLIPIFSTSATAVMTHKSPSSMDVVDGAPVDARKSYTFERYLVVGDGDVGSVLETVHVIRGEAVGRVEGVVLDELTGAPVTHASVFAVKDPRKDPAEAEPANYDELLSMCRAAFGNDGIYSQMQTDRGLDLMEDGDYSGPLEPGSWFLVAFDAGRGVSLPQKVEIVKDQTSVAHLLIPRRGLVKYRVRDEGGLLLPSRLTFIPLDDSGSPLRWDGLSRVELGGSRYDHGIYRTEHAWEGQGEEELPAGKYEIWVSRGFEYGVEHIPSFEVLGGATKTLDVTLIREVDTSGFVSADFHVHCQPSIDSSLPYRQRVAAAVAEGLEFVTATDHDSITDYMPFINEMGVMNHLKSAVGVETTTLEFGHYNGFPLEYDHTDIPVHGPPPWYGKPLSNVFEMLRDRVENGYSRDDLVLQVNHPRDGFQGFFSQMGLAGYNMERKTGGMETCNPATETIPCDFDAVELMNEKRFELIRTPTILEKTMHNDCFNEIMDATTKSAFAGGPSEPATVCTNLRMKPHPECATIENVLGTTTATGLELARLHSLADHCRWHQEFYSGIAGCTDRMTLIECKKNALDWLKLLTVKYMLERTPEEQEAYFATTPETDVGCSWDDATKGCFPTDGSQPDLSSGCGIQPCMSKQQVLEDWFQLLNFGMNVTAVGNSDSHDVKAEIGLPRNYVVSSTDSPAAIDPAEIFRNVKQHKVMISTGPFLSFSLDGKGIGETVSKPTSDKLKARIKVQTASWFGVGRVEIHRNGKLEHIFRFDSQPEALVDYDKVIELDRPVEDSWYVVITMGLESDQLLSPVYKRIPLGKMLIPTIISMGAKSLLASFPQLIAKIQSLAPDTDIQATLADLVGTEEMPDSFPMFPFAMTNPIWVDLDGDGFKPPLAVDVDADGKWDLPPFCSKPCKVEMVANDDGTSSPGRSTCGENQICRPDAEGASLGTCAIPIPGNCPD